MKRTSRRIRLAIFGTVATIAAAAVAVATGAIPDSAGVIHGCYSASGSKSTGGTGLNIVDSAKTACGKGLTEVTWSQQGPPGPAGKDGVSVTSATLGSGDSHCANGGSSFTSASGTSYACNGAQGPKGDTGPKGDPGPAGSADPFSLQDQPCEFGDYGSSYDVSTDTGTGAVSIVCIPVVLVSANITNGTMSQVFIVDGVFSKYNAEANQLSGVFASTVARGDSPSVQLISGNQAIGGGSDFGYRCNGGPLNSATAHPGSEGGTYYDGECDPSGLTSNYQVTVTFN